MFSHETDDSGLVGLDLPLMREDRDDRRHMVQMAYEGNSNRTSVGSEVSFVDRIADASDLREDLFEGFAVTRHRCVPTRRCEGILHLQLRDNGRTDGADKQRRSAGEGRI